VKNASRCYTNAYPHQVPPNIASPTANSKYLGKEDVNLALRRKINLVRFPYPQHHPHPLMFKQTVPTIAAKYCEKTAASGFCDILNTYGDLLNTPSIGETLQHLFTNVQVNISPAASGTGDGQSLLRYRR
jgi:hypothetical protein